MSDESWDRARLIPTSGINGADEQERRAVSVLLAVIGGVPDFGRAVIQPLGAPAGVIETFIDVSFGIGDRKCVPDGLIRVRHGQRTWTALVEVRTGSTPVDGARLGTLVDVADSQGFDAVLTISNQRPGAAGPVLDPGLPADIVLAHHSWDHLLAEAVSERERERAREQAELAELGELGGPGAADRSWVLSELIRYLEHPRSGAIEDSDSAHLAALESRPRVFEVDLRDPQITVLHTVVIAEPAVRRPPTLPSRREVRLVRQLGAGAGDPAAGNDAGWYQDPKDSGQLRWWDGVGWSERTYPGQPALA